MFRNVGPGSSRLSTFHTSSSTESSLVREGYDDAPAYGEYADIFLVIVSGLGLLKLIYGDEISPDAFERAFRAVLKGMEKPKEDS